MKIDKKLKKNIDKMVRLSFDVSGKMNENNTLACVKNLKSLSGAKVIPAMDEYLRGLKREIKKTTLEISSAVSLSDAQVDSITKLLKVKSLINQVETKIDSSLLGGISIKIGDVVYDDSVSQKIIQLRGAMNG